MKALILAAGLGTRLLPYTRHTPKPLFPVGGMPLLEIHIRNLASAGCEGIAVNTHHLHEQIAEYIAAQTWPVPVKAVHEPVILGTGGAIRNVADFWDQRPFMVINSDILTDTDLREVYDFHIRHSCPVTLVLHDTPEFNHVSVSEEGFVTGFHEPGAYVRRSFTGIQVLDPSVPDFIPSEGFSSSIDVYRQMLTAGIRIRAFDSGRYFWKDLGTPQRYREAVREHMTAEAFRLAFPGFSPGCMEETVLQGDGSDRQWRRFTSQGRSLVMADHGIRMQKNGTAETDSFADIGRHLYRQGAAVPRIWLHDRFSGMVFLEDLGDTRLQDMVLHAQTGEILTLYRKVIDRLTDLWISGGENFNPDWCWQTGHYDREVILERECRYFTDAFLKGYAGVEIYYTLLQDEFEHLADKIRENEYTAFMHRDMQSRNIMVKNGEPYFIDFQGGRMGPMQYDLASLLIDPYVRLETVVQQELLEYCMEKLSESISLDSEKFRNGYAYCALSRNLQILGAFGFLSRVKKKTWFENYIPTAYAGLFHRLSSQFVKEFPKLRRAVMNCKMGMGNRFSLGDL
ncbi:MAG: sugar phosphate nucleotidyltransferase [Desulfococcaceae bacterium]